MSKLLPLLLLLATLIQCVAHGHHHSDSVDVKRADHEEDHHDHTTHHLRNTDSHEDQLLHVHHFDHDHVRRDNLDSLNLEFGRSCGVRDFTDEEFKAAEEHFKLRLSSKADDAAKFTGATINVYVHILQNSEGSIKVKTKQINDQIDVLNSAFKNNWRFVLQDIDTTVKDNWAKMKPGSASELNAKKALRVGSAEDLNIYIADITYLGWAYYPTIWEKNPDLDGVVLHYGSLPGGFIDLYNLGETAPHEVGHWLGLAHTFAGGCQADPTRGDGVRDTPAVKNPNFGCPGEVDSCPELRGKDLTTNIMDYVDDRCMLHFTEGQYKRMNEMYVAYRLGN